MKKFLLKEILISASLFIICVLLYCASKTFAPFNNFNNKLSPTSISLLKSFEYPLTMTLYTPNEDLHRQIKTLVNLYQRYQPQLEIDWLKRTTDAAHLPQEALIINYLQAKEIIDLQKVTMNESTLSNVLFKLQRKPNQWIVFLQGHHEPSPFGKEMRDFGLFTRALENQGLKVQALNLTQTPFIPDNTSTLIIASPQTGFLPQEEELILAYLQQGKDLLWLNDPQSDPLSFLSKYLGISTYEGTIADMHGYQLGTPHPGISIIDAYPTLPFEAPFTLSAFPFAQALKKEVTNAYHSFAFLTTNDDSWTEKNFTNKEIAFNEDENEVKGPLTLGLLLTKEQAQTQQRIVVIGNSRFLSNGAIENYGNLALGLNMCSWLNHDDLLLNIAQPVVNDSMLQIHLFSALAIQYGFPILCLLLCFYSIGLFYWRKKRSSILSIDVP
ncbi:MAG: Gldg family protein [Proteobacteria bacterium]|nr:Gldg family protein [Pseudomonadota bacterium]